MNNENPPSRFDGDRSVLEKHENIEERITKACRRVIAILNKYKLKVSNFDYLRIRAIAQQFFDEWAQYKKDKIDEMDKTGDMEFGGINSGQYLEIIHRYFLETYGIYFEQLRNVPITEKLTKYLERRRDPNVRDSLDNF